MTASFGGWLHLKEFRLRRNNYNLNAKTQGRKDAVWHFVLCTLASWRLCVHILLNARFCPFEVC